MNDVNEGSNDRVEIVDYDPRWPEAYKAERNRILAAISSRFEHFEHIGSTSVPGLSAKPIIDMMAAVPELVAAQDVQRDLEALDYRPVETGMNNRLFMLRQVPHELRYHLHIFETATWEERKERHLRDYLRAKPMEARAYGALKRELAADHRNDPLAYTRAKTAFLQRISDAMRDAQGLSRIDVWKE